MLIIILLMKYKKLTNEQILISIDRLTRFKKPKDKYYRVFTDIITTSLIEPKLKKNEIMSMAPEKIRDIVTEIINSSLINYSDNLKINNKIYEYETSVYNIEESEKILINNKINYQEIVKLITDDSPKNLLWLKELNSDINQVKNRFNKSLKYPIEKVLLVEGLTEELLLPVFAKKLDYDFDKYGVQIIPAGGKNQVVKMYYKLVNELKIPIYILLDRDAEANINQIKPKLRTTDKIHLVSCGEFEDLLPQSLLIKTVNSLFSNFASINSTEFNSEISNVENLEEIFKKFGTCNFKKADFAKAISVNINDDSDISGEIRNIIKEISLDSKICSC